MESSYVISDDDESYEGPGDSLVTIDISKSLNSTETTNNCDTISISSDEETGRRSSIDDDIEMHDLPKVRIRHKNETIKNLFKFNNNENKPVSNIVESNKSSTKKVLFPQNVKEDVKVVEPRRLDNVKTEVPQTVVHKSMPIQGVNVLLPVKPYGCQIALMAKIIEGIKTSKNCILESPTGSGKTLALLCGALAWQQSEEKRISQEDAKMRAQAYFSQYPELEKQEVIDYIATPTKKSTNVIPEKLFAKNNFGEASIYQKASVTPGQSPSTSGKRMGPYKDDSDDEGTEDGLVKIHKKPRLLLSLRRRSLNQEDKNKIVPPVTPEKNAASGDDETPEKVRQLYDRVNNLRLATSCFVDCRVPTIYYSARTHTQLQQVIKEFKRTWYCGQVKMSLLSSRDKSCIRPFNRDQWASKNDMCRACIKSVAKPDETKNQDDTNCKYYDNRRELNHGCMPPAFDLEELIAAGEDKQACPYYGARDMAKTADIIFCPYNYLIDPSIRSNLKIDLQDNIVVIDEAHNIESNCREAASMTLTQTQVQDALKEIEKVAESRYANRDVLSFIDELILTLKGWNDWFQNQMPIIDSKRVDDNKAEHAWTQTRHFVDTLNNHNIGYTHFPKFKSNCETFCRQLRDDPRTLLGVTQTTGSLLEALVTVLSYLYREDCKHLDDYKMVLEMVIKGSTGSYSSHNWRKSNFNKEPKLLSLRMLCLNSGVVMSALSPARSIVLASGTLTPVGNMHAELAAPFPLVASRPHVIPADRVWVGVVSGDAEGPQQYTNRGNQEPSAAARLGRLVARVCTLTPHGVLCFITSYTVLNRFIDKWKESGLWYELNQLKNVFCEKRNSTEHEDMMQDFYQCVGTPKGALLFAVYRGKVSEGMDFKDHQARAVICMGIPFPNTFDKAVEAKMQYNDKYNSRGLLRGNEWLKVQAYRALNQAVGRCVRHQRDWGAVLLVHARSSLYNTRALNQAVGRCVRHQRDWGAVLLVDARYSLSGNIEHLSKWVRDILGHNLHTYESIQTSTNGLAEFMKRMKITEEEEATCD